MNCRYRTLIVTTLLLAGPVGAGRNIDAYLMDEGEELGLAATAGPPSITVEASYYVLKRSGFVLAREGSNGWHCFVERVWFYSVDESTEYDPRVRAPHCINQEGSQTRMQDIFMTTRLAIEGLSQQEVESRIDAAYRSGELRLPERLAMTYMMPKKQWLGQSIGNWCPHMMIWLPYLDEGSVGKNELMSGHAVIGNGARTRNSVLIIPVTEFIE